MFHGTCRRLMAPLIAVGLAACSGAVDPPASSAQAAWALQQKIAFVSTRDDPNGNPQLAAEIYLMNVDAEGNPDTNPAHWARLTSNGDGDGFPAISPDGKSIVFDSNRLRTADPPYPSDLFLMAPDGSDQTYLTRGSSASWSPDGHDIVFHRSASGTGLPINPNPGAATTDSDIFVANVDDLLAAAAAPVDITSSSSVDASGQRVYINDDADWSPDGEKIVFTRKRTNDPCLAQGCTNYVTGEVWLMNADGSALTQLTVNEYEERSPSWSPDGSKFVYMCRVGASTCGPFGNQPCPFQLCIMDRSAGGTYTSTQLTYTSRQHLTPSFSPDGGTIIFHTAPLQLFTIPASGGSETQLTFAPGLNGFADWGHLKVNFPSSPK